MTKAGLSLTVVILFTAAMCLPGCSGFTKQEPRAIQKVMYDCVQGEPVLVRFYTGKGRAVLIYDAQVIELPQEPTGSGFYYTNGKIGIRGKGDKLLLEIGRMAPIKCHAR